MTKFSKDWYDKIFPKGSRPGILYGNAKTHKPVVNNLSQSRPTLPAINTPGYNIATFLIPKVELFTLNEVTIKDFFSFGKEITIVHYICLVLMLSFHSLTFH